MTEKREYNKLDKTSEAETMCKGCPQGDECRKVWSAAYRGSFTSTGLSLSSALVFLLPIATAIAAAAIAKGFLKQETYTTIIQFVAAGGGFVLGAFVAWLLMPVIKKRFYERKTEKNYRGN